jgi:grpE
MSKEKKDPALKDGGKAEKNNEAQEARENYQDCASGQEREEQPLKEAGETQADYYINLAKRVQADFDNYRRRNAAVYADALLEGKLEVIKGLLPVLDNLDRALAGEQKGSGSLYEGLVMIRKQLIDLIHSMGVEEIGAEGEAFDPNYHNAVMQSDCASGQKPGEIAEVLIKGYKLGDKIVRHTMVRVTK